MTPGGHTFSNGDHFPQGAVVQLPTWYVQTDSTAYENPHEFNGFRFVNDKHPESAPSDIFMAFGHGHHAW
jgi:cytochrome P450